MLHNRLKERSIPTYKQYIRKMTKMTEFVHVWIVPLPFHWKYNCEFVMTWINKFQELQFCWYLSQVHSCHYVMYALWSEQLLKNKATPFRFTYILFIIVIDTKICTTLVIFPWNWVDNWYIELIYHKNKLVC